MFTGALVIAGIVLLCVVIVMAFEKGENAGAWKERNEWVRSVPEYGSNEAHHFTSRKSPGIRIVDGRFYAVWEVERIGGFRDNSTTMMENRWSRQLFPWMDAKSTGLPKK